MSILANKKVVLIAIASSVLAVTGCSTKNNKSQVAVSPLGMYGPGSGAMGANGAGGYNGGSLVNNNANVSAQASGLPNTVYFGYDSSNITAKSSGLLNQHASLLGSNPGARVLVVGHTDPRGSREYNMALGERRAQAVRGYLSSKGVNTSSVEVTSRGEEEPAVAGNSSSAYAKDRRAVLSY